MIAKFDRETLVVLYADRTSLACNLVHSTETFLSYEKATWFVGDMASRGWIVVVLDKVKHDRWLLEAGQATGDCDDDC